MYAYNLLPWAVTYCVRSLLLDTQLRSCERLQIQPTIFILKKFSANAADLIFLHDSWLIVEVFEAEKEKNRNR